MEYYNYYIRRNFTKRFRLFAFFLILLLLLLFLFLVSIVVTITSKTSSTSTSTSISTPFLNIQYRNQSIYENSPNTISNFLLYSSQEQTLLYVTTTSRSTPYVSSSSQTWRFPSESCRYVPTTSRQFRNPLLKQKDVLECQKTDKEISIFSPPIECLNDFPFLSTDDNQQSIEILNYSFSDFSYNLQIEWEITDDSTNENSIDIMYNGVLIGDLNSGENTELVKTIQIDASIFQEENLCGNRFEFITRNNTNTFSFVIFSLRFYRTNEEISFPIPSQPILRHFSTDSIVLQISSVTNDEEQYSSTLFIEMWNENENEWRIINESTLITSSNDEENSTTDEKIVDIFDLDDNREYWFRTGLFWHVSDDQNNTVLPIIPQYSSIVSFFTSNNVFRTFTNPKLDAVQIHSSDVLSCTFPSSFEEQLGFEFWVKLLNISSIDSNPLFRLEQQQNTSITVFLSTSLNEELDYYPSLEVQYETIQQNNESSGLIRESISDPTKLSLLPMEWYHISVTLTKQQLGFEVDGKEIASRIISKPFFPFSDNITFSIGDSSSTNAEVSLALFDEIRIWNSVDFDQFQNIRLDTSNNVPSLKQVLRFSSDNNLENFWLLKYTGECIYLSPTGESVSPILNESNAPLEVETQKVLLRTNESQYYSDISIFTDIPFHFNLEQSINNDNIPASETLINKLNSTRIKLKTSDVTQGYFFIRNEPNELPENNCVGVIVNSYSRNIENKQMFNNNNEIIKIRYIPFNPSKPFNNETIDTSLTDSINVTIENTPFIVVVKESHFSFTSLSTIHPSIAISTSELNNCLINSMSLNFSQIEISKTEFIAGETSTFSFSLVDIFNRVIPEVFTDSWITLELQRVSSPEMNQYKKHDIFLDDEYSTEYFNQEQQLIWKPIQGEITLNVTITGIFQYFIVAEANDSKIEFDKIDESNIQISAASINSEQSRILNFTETMFQEIEENEFISFDIGMRDRFGNLRITYEDTFFLSLRNIDTNETLPENQYELLVSTESDGVYPLQMSVATAGTYGIALSATEANSEREPIPVAIDQLEVVEMSVVAAPPPGDTSPEEDDNGGGSALGTILGIVGGVVGGIFICALISCLISLSLIVLRKRRRSNNNNNDDNDNNGSSNGSSRSVRAEAESANSTEDTRLSRTYSQFISAGKAASKSQRQTLLDVLRKPSLLRDIAQQNNEQDAAGTLGAARIKINTRNFEVSFQELEIISKIGQGNYGVVYKARWANDIVAVKAFSVNPSLVSEIEFEEMVRDFENEIQVLSEHRHRNLLLFMGACVQSPHLCIITEYMEMGNLNDILRRKRVDLTWKQKINIMLQVAHGMNYLHHKNLIHRDLKSFNIFLDGSMTAKIGDFGLARMKNRLESSVASMTKFVGSPLWMAPEIARGEDYGCACDVYSFGIVMAEVFNEQAPYYDIVNKSVVPFRVASNPDFRPSICPDMKETRDALISRSQDEYLDLMKRCWDHNPEDRPGFDDICNELEEQRRILSQHFRSQRIEEQRKIKNKTNQSNSNEPKNTNINTNTLKTENIDNNNNNNNNNSNTDIDHKNNDRNGFTDGLRFLSITESSNTNRPQLSTSYTVDASQHHSLPKVRKNQNPSTKFGSS